MLKITNGQNVIEVSRGAFEGTYKSQGYYILGGNKPKQEETHEPQEDIEEVASDINEDTEDEFNESYSEDEDDLVNKPLNKWSKNEVKAFALENGIDISGTKNVNEAKDKIKEFLEG